MRTSSMTSAFECFLSGLMSATQSIVSRWRLCKQVAPLGAVLSGVCVQAGDAASPACHPQSAWGGGILLPLAISPLPWRRNSCRSSAPGCCPAASMPPCVLAAGGPASRPQSGGAGRKPCAAPAGGPAIGSGATGAAGAAADDEDAEAWPYGPSMARSAIRCLMLAGGCL